MNKKCKNLNMLYTWLTYLLIFSLMFPASLMFPFFGAQKQIAYANTETAGNTGITQVSANTAANEVEIKIGENIGYAGYSTCHVTDSKTGYALICAQPSKATPSAGKYTKDYNWKNDVAKPDYSECEDEEDRETALWLYENRIAMIERVFYFGHPDSPGFDREFWPDKWYDGNSMGKGEYISLTHVVLSDLYANDLKTATYGCNESFRNWIAEKITGGYSNGDGSVTKESKKNSVYGKMYHTRTNADWTVPEEFKIYRISTGTSTQVMFGIEAVGYIEVNKSSNNNNLLENSACYSLLETTYGIYTDKSCSDIVAKLSTNKDGYAKSEALDLGDYYVKELKAPAGHKIDTSVNKVTVTCGTSANVDKSKTVNKVQLISIEILLKKLDKESMKNTPLGSAKLNDARFSFKYFDNTKGTTSGQAKYSWIFKTDEKGEINLQKPDEYLVSGDALFKTSDGAYGLPIGTYEIKETKAPEGYLINEDTFVKTVTTNDETIEKITTYNAISVSEQVKRGDISFNKKNGKTGNNMSAIPFKLTSKTTGESHVIVTDDNGYFSSASSWIAHSSNTNINDLALLSTSTDTNANADTSTDTNANASASTIFATNSSDDSTSEDNTETDKVELIDASMLNKESGLWFGKQVDGTYSAVNDNLGALPYDDYILEELACEANAGMNLLKDESISITRNSTEINFGTIDNESNDVPPEDEPPTPDPSPDPDPEPKIVKSSKIVKHTEKERVIEKTYPAKTGESNYLVWILILAAISCLAACLLIAYKKHIKQKQAVKTHAKP